MLQRRGRPKPIVRIAAYLLRLDNAFVLDLSELRPTLRRRAASRRWRSMPASRWALRKRVRRYFSESVVAMRGEARADAPDLPACE